MTVRTDGLTVCLFLNSSVFFIHCMILVCLLSCLFISFRLPEDKSFVPVEGFIALPDSQLSPFRESNAWISDDKNSFQRWPDNFLRLTENFEFARHKNNSKLSNHQIPNPRRRHRQTYLFKIFFKSRAFFLFTVYKMDIHTNFLFLLYMYVQVYSKVAHSRLLNKSINWRSARKKAINDFC